MVVILSTEIVIGEIPKPKLKNKQYEVVERRPPSTYSPRDPETGKIKQRPAHVSQIARARFLGIPAYLPWAMVVTTRSAQSRPRLCTRLLCMDPPCDFTRQRDGPFSSVCTTPHSLTPFRPFQRCSVPCPATRASARRGRGRLEEEGAPLSPERGHARQGGRARGGGAIRR